MKSQILIVNDITQTLEQLLPTLPKHFTRIIRSEDTAKDEFLLLQSQKAIKEAYIASNEIKYIILCGSTFRKEAQNALLKLLEEPPKNVVFIILTSSKSALLPTILSRMPYKYQKTNIEVPPCHLDFKKLDMKEVYTFLKENQKISKIELKSLIESMMYKIHQQNIQLKTKELDVFSQAIKLNDLNSRPINVLTWLLLTLLHAKGK